MTVITHTFTVWDVLVNYVVDVLSIAFGFQLEHNISFTYNIMLGVILQTLNVVYEQYDNDYHVVQ